MCFSDVCAGGRGIIAEKRTEIVHRKISKFYFICVVFQCGKNSVSNIDEAQVTGHRLFKSVLVKVRSAMSVQKDSRTRFTV